MNSLLDRRGPRRPRRTQQPPLRVERATCQRCGRRGFNLSGQRHCGARGWARYGYHVHHDDGWHPVQRGPKR